MSLSHHEPPDQSQLWERFRQQQDGTAKREYPSGRLGPRDEGSLVVSIDAIPDKQVITIGFPKPVSSIGMTPQEAIELAQSLIKTARQISNKPLSISLH